jgi:cytochrome c oxidase assembly factor CtaG
MRDKHGERSYGMNTAPFSVDGGHRLTIYLVGVVLLTAVFDVLLIITLAPVWGMAGCSRRP